MAVEPQHPIIEHDPHPPGAIEECELCTLHKHPFGIFMLYAQVLIGVGISFALLFWLIPQVANNGDPRSLHGVLAIIALVVTLLAAIFLGIATWMYNASRLIITNQNLTQIFQQGIFKRQTSRLTMANIEDVTAEQNGLFATIFKFGTLKIETAGEEENFHFTYCPNPDYYAKLVLETRESFDQELYHS